MTSPPNPNKANIYGLVQGEANAVAPGKRPLSSMTPTIVLDAQGKTRYILGTPGGPTIITNVMQVFLNLVAFGLSPADAVAAPKIHHQCLPDRISVEKEIPSPQIVELRKWGHDVKERSAIGDFQLIVVEGEQRLGVSDLRGGGAAVGQ